MGRTGRSSIPRNDPRKRCFFSLKAAQSAALARFKTVAGSPLIHINKGQRSLGAANIVHRAPGVPASTTLVVSTTSFFVQPHVSKFLEDSTLGTKIFEKSAFRSSRTNTYMAIAKFEESLAVGKNTERLAEAVLTRRGSVFEDVRSDPLYQKVDVDYVVDGKTYEVKQNLHVAQKGVPGYYFWVELSIGNNPGWWQFTEADYFMFFEPFGRSYVEVRVDDVRQRINDAVAEEGHAPESRWRFDYKKDYRRGGVVEAKSMRVYLSEIRGLYKHYRIISPK